MKIVIIGPNEADPSLIEEAKEVFDEVLYVPLDSIKLEVGEEQKAYYENIDLSTFDAILPLMNEKNREFMFLCLKILEKNIYTPISSKDFFLIENDAIIKKKLTKIGLKIRKSAIIASDKTSRMVIENLKFPIIMRSLTGKPIRITNEETLKNILALFKAGHIRILEKPMEAESVIWCFVVGNEIVASYEETKETTRSIRVDSDTESKLLKIRMAINSDFFVVNFIQKRNELIVNDIHFTPDFSQFKKITGKDVSKLLLVHIRNKLEAMRVGPITSFVNTLYDYVKKLWKP